MRINTNVAGINSWRSLYRNDNALNKSLEKLSSGLRINRSSDDAGGLALSETLRAQIRGTAQAERNAQDGIGLLSIADSTLDQVHGMLQRMRELAVQNANGTLQDTPDRASVDAEFQQLKTEIGRITSASTFNNTPIFGAATSLQVGANNVAAEQMNVSVATASIASLALTTTDVTTQGTSQTAIDDVNAAINTISAQRATIGAQINRLDYTIANLQSTRENLSAAESRIRDTDMASESTNLTKQQILSQSATAMLAQANSKAQNVLALLR